MPRTRTRKSSNSRRRNKHADWYLRRALKIERRRKGIRENGVAFSPQNWLTINHHTVPSVKVKDGRLILELPENLDFEENYESTASHFLCFRSAIDSGVRLRSLRFTKIRFISPSAALVLASEVDRWQQKRTGEKRGPLRADVDSWDKDIERLLAQMGYFELLGLPRPALQPVKNTVFLPFRRGDVNDRDAGKMAKQLRIDIEELVGFSIKRHLLFEGLSEAITNVCQHAYQTQLGSRHWWLSASYDKEATKLCVTFYDQGVGIPATLPISGLREFVAESFDRLPDSEKIKAAMRIGRSATDMEERGKGLQNLLEFARSYPEGRLAIYSLKGLYRMESRSGTLENSETTSLRDHENTVGGTLIEWTVRLN